MHPIADKLLEVLQACWAWIAPFAVVRCYEGGILLRLGNVVRDLSSENGIGGTGLHCFVPFGIHTVMTCNVVTDMERLDPQPLTTKDDVAITIQPALTYRVKDARKLLIETEDREKALHDSAAGIVASLVAQHTWAELRTPAFVDAAYKAVRARGFRYGIELVEIQFPGLQRTKSLTILQPQRRSPE